MEADSVFESADSDSYDPRTMTMTQSISTPCLSVTQPPSISVTPPNVTDDSISLVESESHVLLEPPLEFANGEDEYENDRMSDYNHEQEGVKHYGMVDESTDENESEFDKVTQLPYLL